jgi:hypothetical protein
MIKNGLNPKFKNSCLENETGAFQAQRCSLSAPIHNYGNILAVLFFPTRTLNVEWIRS